MVNGFNMEKVFLGYVKSLWILGISVFLIAALSIQSSYAQEAQIKVLTSKITKPVERKGMIYYPVNYSRLAELAWKYGVYSYDDFEALTQYIILQHCEIYGQYIQNDFAWTRILESKKREMNYFSKAVNDRFALSDVIELSRFDFEHNVFYLKSSSIMQNTGVLDLFNGHNISYGDCANRYARSLSKYPPTIRLEIINPLSMNSFPLDPKGARTLLEEFEKRGDDKRVLFARLYVKFDDVIHSRIVGAVADNILYQGFLERYEIYADIEYKKLVFSKDFRRTF